MTKDPNKKEENEHHLRAIQKIMNKVPWIVIGVVIFTVIITIIQLLLSHSRWSS